MSEHEVTEAMVDAAVDTWLNTPDRESMHETARAMIEAALASRTTPTAAALSSGGNRGQ